MAVFNSLFLIHLLLSTTARQLNGHEHECPTPDCPAPVPGCTTRANPAAMDRHGCLADPCGWRECAFFSGPAAPRWGHAEVVWRPGADAAEGARLQAAVDRAADVWRRGSAAPFTVLARFAAATAALSAPLSVRGAVADLSGNATGSAAAAARTALSPAGDGGGHRLFAVSEGGHLVLRHLRLAGGRARDGNGGGAARVEAAAFLTVEYCAFEGNAGALGGALAVAGGAAVFDSSFAGNTAGAGAEDGAGAGGAFGGFGGAVFVHAGGEVSLTRCAFAPTNAAAR